MSASEAKALWLELLAGCEQPEGIPEGAKKLIICDSGCARTVLNHRDQTEPGSVRKGKSNLCGADGKFSAEYRADSRLPMPTTERGIGVYRESNCILHEPCPYVLLAIAVLAPLEGWNPLQCAYFSVVTLTTVGYGDLVPSTPAGKCFGMGFAICGVVVVAALLNVALRQARPRGSA